VFTNILLPVDGTPTSLRAARRGIQLAKLLSAKVTVLTVTTPWAAYFARELAVVIPEVVIPKGDYDYKRETTAACILQNVVAEARVGGVQAKSCHRCHRDPYRAIIDTAEHEGCDLIVMGSDCDADFIGTLLGSETMKVITHNSIPVLVYRHRLAP
jgi:nucleotide-binding universal stress UspA family protein